METQPRLLWLQCWLFWRGSESHAQSGSEVQVEVHGLECLKSRKFLSSSFGTPALIFWPLHRSSWGCRNAAMCRLQPSPRQAWNSGLCILWGISLDDRKQEDRTQFPRSSRGWRQILDKKVHHGVLYLVRGCSLCAVQDSLPPLVPPFSPMRKVWVPSETLSNIKWPVFI